MRINTENLTPMQLGRLNKQLDKLYRYEGLGVMSLRQYIERQETITKGTVSGSIDYNRSHFNRLSASEQRDYEARLAAKRYYTINDTIVPKIVFDAVTDN